MDDDLAKFEEMTKDVEVSRRARRDARRAARRQAERDAGEQARAAKALPGGAVPRPRRGWAAVVAWAEDRAHSRSRPWAGR